MTTLDTIGMVLGAILTLFTISYLLGDNPLYKLATNLFIGTLVGYSLGIVLRDVMVGMLLTQLADDPITAVIPLALGLLLLFKGFPKQAYVGNLSVAYLLGVGVAVALGGALAGTLAPQIQATGHALHPDSLASYRFGLIDGLMVVIGTVCTLLSFAFIKVGPKQGGNLIYRLGGKLIGAAGTVGRVFLIFAFGIAFAGALTASLTILIGRLQYLIDAYFRILGLLGS